MNGSPNITYDAAGNETWDGSNYFTYDADGDVIQVNNGTTDTFTYDALNQRVRIQRGSSSAFEFSFDQYGRRISIWNLQGYTLDSALAYWDGGPLGIWTGGAFYYQHQDWLGTERMITTSSGQQQSSYTSLPFGDGYVYNGGDIDWYHFAGTENDIESHTQHAQFRQYASSRATG